MFVIRPQEMNLNAQYALLNGLTTHAMSYLHSEWQEFSFSFLSRSPRLEEKNSCSRLKAQDWKKGIFVLVTSEIDFSSQPAFNTISVSMYLHQYYSLQQFLMEARQMFKDKYTGQCCYYLLAHRFNFLGYQPTRWQTKCAECLRKQISNINMCILV